MAERLGNRAINKKVAGSIPGREKWLCVLGQGTSPCLPRGELPCTYCKSLWIRKSAKWLKLLTKIRFKLQMHQYTFFQFRSNSDTWIWISVDTNTRALDFFVIVIVVVVVGMMYKVAWGCGKIHMVCVLYDLWPLCVPRAPQGWWVQRAWPESRGNQDFQDCQGSEIQAFL